MNAQVTTSLAAVLLGVIFVGSPETLGTAHQANASAEATSAPVQAEPPPTPTGVELMKRAEEMRRLTDEINRQSAQYPHRPKRKFISASVGEEEYRAYMNDVLGKIEKTANNNFPETIGQRGIAGRVIIAISIARDGSLNGTTIIRSSGDAMLDDAAITFVKMASPFPPIPTKDDIDFLEIVRTFDFKAGPPAPGNPMQEQQPPKPLGGV